MKSTLTAVTAAALALVLAASADAGADQPRPRPEPGTSATGAPKALDRFYQQNVRWGPCESPDLARTGTECAKVTVPLDYAAPTGRTLSVAVSRLKATGPATARRGIIQTNPGGPGGRGLDFPAALRAKMTPQVAAAYDVIGMDTRGLGKSEPLDCGLNSLSWLRGTGFDRAAFDRVAKQAADDAAKCDSAYGDSLRHYSTRNIARDVDVVRGALRERKTSWFGQSYGTYLGAVYAQMFPGKVDRLVLDSALNPREYGRKTTQAMGPANEKALDELAAWAAPRDAVYHLGKTPAAVRATVEGLVRRAAERPIAIGTYRLDAQNLPFILFAMGTDDFDNAQYAAVLRQLADAAAGRKVEATERLAGLLAAMFPTGADENGTRADYAAQLAVLCADTTMPGDPEEYRRTIERVRPRQPVFGPVVNAPMPCGWWKHKPHERRTEIDNTVPALQLQATGDTRTTYEQGLGMHKAMRGSTLVTVPVRTHAVFAYYPNACANKTVNDYLLTGDLPAADTTCARD
ncbi:alpha/beta fold hydrolase [Streptomyces stramineus]